MSCLWSFFGLRSKKKRDAHEITNFYKKEKPEHPLEHVEFEQQHQRHIELTNHAPSHQPQQHHQFRIKRVRRERPCHACHRPLAGRASCCRVCKYVCHESCENKEGERFSDTSWQIHRQWREGDGPSWPGLQRSSLGTMSKTRFNGSNSTPVSPASAKPSVSMPIVNFIDPTNFRRTDNEDVRKAMSRLELQSPGQMEISYVTERILVLWIPKEVTNVNKNTYEREAAHMLHNKHGQNYMIFNLTDRRPEIIQEHGERVCELGWRTRFAPPIEGLCSLCKKVNAWLEEDPNHVAVLRSCGSRERFIVAVSSYLKYSSICSQQKYPVDHYVMRQFLDTSAALVTVPPSYLRYVEYFGGLLARRIKVNAAPLQLTHVTVVGAPPMSHVFLKLYEGIVPIYTSNVYFLGSGVRQFTASLGSSLTNGSVGGVAVRGDVLLRCYTRTPPLPIQSSTPLKKSERKLIFSCQFHTCAVSDYTIIFGKNDLDYACNDDQFPVDGTVEIQVAGAHPSPAPTPAVRVHSVDDAISRWDSLQDIHNHSLDEEDGHGGGEPRGETEGGGEGPIYATVSRRAGSGSPLSASMDSGISSAGRRQGSPSPGSRRRELDALLRDMLRTVEALPEPVAAHSVAGPRAADIPYHARPDSRPFTYGAVAPLAPPAPPAPLAPLAPPDMLRAQAGLSSPSLVRRALRSPPCNGVRLGRDSPPDNIDRLFSPEANESFRWRELKEEPRRERRLTREELLAPPAPSPTTIPRPRPAPRIEESVPEVNGRGEGGLTWLQRQQQRLRARHAARQYAARLPTERPLPPARASASHRFDGYTSDTTAFADDDDDFGMDIHRTTRINSQNSYEPILPNRVSSRKYMSLERTVVRERSISPSTRGISDMLDSPIGRDTSMLSYADRSCAGTMTREESLSSWRSMSVSEVEGTEGEDGYSPSRGTTPAFPIAPCTPYPPATPPSRLPLRSPVSQRKDFSHLSNSRLSPVSNTSTLEPLLDVSADNVKFVRDTSKFWYKPNISRDDAIMLLQNQDMGAFIIRDSNSFPNAFGVALKVTSASDKSLSITDSVRHFLIEPTSRGVRLKGSPDEPVFSSLSALVYQHSITPLALPVRLKLPASDLAPPGPTVAAQELLAAGAACSVLYLGGVGCEALTGPDAIARTAARLLSQKPVPIATVVHFKVSASGITLTDSTRRLFFRRHYATAAVSYCGLDPESRKWKYGTVNDNATSSNRIFGFVSRKSGSASDNECHVFTELEPEQPATAIVNFVSKVMLGQTPSKYIV